MDKAIIAQRCASCQTCVFSTRLHSVWVCEEADLPLPIKTTESTEEADLTPSPRAAGATCHQRIRNSCIRSSIR